MAVENSFKSYENCCRTCMNENSTFDLYKETLNSKNLADILISCTKLNVREEDCLPKKMCGRCYNCLVNFYHFREIAEKIDSKFREIFSNSQLINSFDHIKIDNVQTIEIKAEEESDIDFYGTEPKVEMYNDNQIFDENENSSVYYDTIARKPVKCKRKRIKEKLVCSQCQKTFRKLSRLQNHMKEHVINNFHLNICTDSNNSINTEVTPLSDNDNKKEIDTLDTDQAYSCKLCPSKFKSVNSLSAHMRVHTEKGRILSCSVCKKVFKKMSHLKRHELMHNRNRLYQCSICPRTFQSEDILNGHMNKHNGVKPHLCPLCPKSFAHLSTLTSHVKIHKKDKILCPTCGKKFDSVTNLDQHVKRHLGLKKFECNMCPRKFVSKGELKSHSVTHTGERSYTCDQCGATFTKSSSLAKHTLRHLGIKPYQCETCSMKFSSKDHLKRHNRIHTGEKPYKCDICERAFTQSNDLVKHRRAHLGEKIYKCTECNESFRLHAELRQHLSDHFVLSRQDPNTPSADKIEVTKYTNTTESDNFVNLRDVNS